MSTFFADDSTETWFADPFGGTLGFDSASSAPRSLHDWITTALPEAPPTRPNRSSESNA